jgi:hypothetical protein
VHRAQRCGLDQGHRPSTSAEGQDGLYAFTIA